jgi:sporulation protein YlmC with PRC-barrel domain
MNKLIAIFVGALMLSTTAIAQTTPESAKVMTTLPSPSIPISDLYKQNVYDTADNKIGEVKDVILSPDGRASALIVSVGGFLGMGEKDVALPFDAVKRKTKDNKTYLTLDATKDALKSAPGFKYDRQKAAWVPENESK